MRDLTLLDEVRLTRHRIAAECGNDLRVIAIRAAEAAQRFSRGVKFVSIPPKHPDGPATEPPLYVAEDSPGYDLRDDSATP